ncbi:ADP-glucose pyrophosphorylase large subunit [Haematococcus lacustris]
MKALGSHRKPLECAYRKETRLVVRAKLADYYANEAPPVPSERRREQRPLLNTIYPRGSVCAVVLGGGETDSRRMFPLTEKRTLPAIPLVGVYRLIDIPLSSLLNSGVNKVFVLTQYNSTSLNRYLQHTYDIHDSITLGRDCFVEVVAATQGPKEQRWAEGAVDAVRQWMEMWAPNANSRSIEDVLVLPSDQIYRLDFTQLIDMHRQSCADLTLVCKPVEEAMLNFMGAVKVGPGAQVIGFEEKPVPERHDQLSMDWDDLVDFMNEPHLASVPFLDPAEGGRTWVGSCGIMVFRSQALQRLLGDNVRAKDFGRDLIPAALKAGMKVMAYHLPSYWIDVGNGVPDFYKFHMDLTRNQVDFSFQDPASPVFGHPDPLPPTMCEDCQLHSSLLAMGCLLRSSSIHSSVIGSRTIIGPGCDIRDSVIMGADYYEHEKQWLRKVGPTYPAIGLGAGCVVHKAIVDKNARIGSNVQLVNKEGVFESMDRIGTGISITGGIIVISKAAVVPDGTRV